MSGDGSEVSLPRRQQTCRKSQRLRSPLHCSVNLSLHISSRSLTVASLRCPSSVLHGDFVGSDTEVWAHNQSDGILVYRFINEERCCHDVFLFMTDGSALAGFKVALC